MSKYKIGDKLKVREDLKCGDIYNDVLVSHSMETLAGKFVTILTINDEDENDILFTIKECRIVTIEKVLLMALNMLLRLFKRN